MPSKTYGNGTIRALSLFNEDDEQIVPFPLSLSFPEKRKFKEGYDIDDAVCGDSTNVPFSSFKPMSPRGTKRK
jgi:hypothetical protein